MFGLSVAAISLPRISFGAAKKRPNFLFLFTDDQTFRSINALNNPDVKTPNIDRLVRRGTTFTHAFNQGSWSGAVCVCSRAMLHTGQFLYHAQRNPVVPQWARLKGFDYTTATTTPLWGETLGAAGYTTFATGKWHTTQEALQRSFKHVGPTGGGMFGSRKTKTADPYNRPRPGNTWSPFDKTLTGHWRKQTDGSTVHSSKLWADAAVGFLDDVAAESTEPFFMYVAFHAPHDPRQSPKEYLDMYPTDKIKIPPNYLPEHPFDQGERYSLRDERLAPFPRSEEAVKVHLQEYYAIISHADAQIGRILDALDKSGRAQDTIIIFSADHGLAVGRHGLMGKQNQYDHSIRMPLVISGPGIERGARIDAQVYLQSMFATTCQIAGVAVPPTVEFPSLLPLLRGEKRKLHDAVFGSYKSFQRMIRTRDYKLIVYPAAGRVQLFDIKNDPLEMTNLADDPKYASKVKQLTARLKKLQKEVGDTLDIDNPPLAGKRKNQSKKKI